MFVFPSMLKTAAENAGIKVPENCEDFDREQFPHFYLFCNAQLGQSMPYPGVHFDNAKVIAIIPNSELKTLTWEQLEEKGFLIGFKYE